MDEKKIKWYSLERIKKCHCQYNMIIGERSNGKTYAILMETLKNWKENRKQSALVRRFDEEIKPSLISTIYAHIIANGELKKLFKKEKWTRIVYKSRCFYLARMDKVKNARGDVTEELVVEEEPFMYTFSLTSEQDYKETAYPNVTLIFFDEFMSRKGFLENEFVLFQNVISTIKRKRQDVVRKHHRQVFHLFHRDGTEACNKDEARRYGSLHLSEHLIEGCSRVLRECNQNQGQERHRSIFRIRQSKTEDDNHWRMGDRHLSSLSL